MDHDACRNPSYRCCESTKPRRARQLRNQVHEQSPFDPSGVTIVEALVLGSATLRSAVAEVDAPPPSEIYSKETQLRRGCLIGLLIARRQERAFYAIDAPSHMFSATPDDMADYMLQVLSVLGVRNPSIGNKDDGK